MFLRMIIRPSLKYEDFKLSFQICTIRTVTLQIFYTRLLSTAQSFFHVFTNVLDYLTCHSFFF